MRPSLPLAIVLSFMITSSAMAETLDEVIAKHLEARGGTDAILAVASARVSGTLSMGGQTEAPVTLIWKRPNKLRLEVVVQGMTGVQVFDGESGWSVMPFMGRTEPEPLAADETNLLEEQADFIEGPFIHTKEKGYAIEYVGVEPIEGAPAHKLEITNARGDVNYIFLDGERFLEIKTQGKRTVGGQEVEFETTQGDYKAVDGLMFAHSIESRPEGAPAGQVLILKSVVLNVDVPDGDFAMPKPAKDEDEDEDENEDETD